MSFSLGQASQPVLLHNLDNLEKVLAKAAAHAAARNIEERVYLEARLAPDMFPLVRQVQIVSDFAVRTVARLAGVEPPAHPDTETSFDELKARIGKARAFVTSIAPEKIDGREDIDITFPAGGDKMTLKGAAYLLGFAMPNFYFHMTTAYAILRHNGVDLGKRDFLGA